MRGFVIDFRSRLLRTPWVKATLAERHLGSSFVPNARCRHRSTMLLGFAEPNVNNNNNETVEEARGHPFAIGFF